MYRVKGMLTLLQCKDDWSIFYMEPITKGSDGFMYARSNTTSTDRNVVYMLLSVEELHTGCRDVFPYRNTAQRCPRRHHPSPWSPVWTWRYTALHWAVNCCVYDLQGFSYILIFPAINKTNGNITRSSTTAPRRQRSENKRTARHQQNTQVAAPRQQNNINKDSTNTTTKWEHTGGSNKAAVLTVLSDTTNIDYWDPCRPYPDRCSSVEYCWT